MELRQLTYFEAVARCGGFTRAAEDLRIAQPAISAQVRRLEADLGVALLTRTTRRVTLTEAGEQFLVRARRVLGEVDAAREDAAELVAVRRGRVVLAATGVLGGFDLPTALAGFARRHPGVAVSLRSGLVATLLADLDAGRADLVLGPLHADLAEAYVATPLREDRLVLITAPGRAPAGPVPTSTWRDGPVVSLPPEAGLRDVLASLGVVDVQYEAPTPSGVRDLVAAGLGVALMAASAVERPGPAVDVHEIRPAIPHPPFGILRRVDRPPNPAAAALYRHLLGR